MWPTMVKGGIKGPNECILEKGFLSNFLSGTQEMVEWGFNSSRKNLAGDYQRLKGIVIRDRGKVTIVHGLEKTVPS